MDAGARFFDYDAAAALTYYAPETIRRFCERGILTRGEHFVIHTYRSGRFIRAVRLITSAGIAALISRRSHPIYRNNARARSEATDRAPT